MNGKTIRTALVSAAWILAIAAGSVQAEPSAAEEARARALAVMEAFLLAFNARDEEAWADTLVYPHVRMASGGVVVYQDRDAFLAAMDLDAFAENTGWRRSTWDDMAVVQASPDKVHIRVVFSRFDADDELIASFDSLYIIEPVNGRWGVRARSSFAP
jgi:hypothetical protein